jgi:DNA-binding NarL/FixJ family response regulator
VASILIVSENIGLIERWSNALAATYRIETISTAPHNPEYLNPAIVLMVIDAELIDREPTLLNQAVNFKAKLLITGCQWPEHHQIMALVTGACGYCETAEPLDLLAQAAASVIKGDIWIQRHLIPMVIGSLVKLKHPAIVAPPAQPVNEKILDSLSEREREVANMVCHGDNNKKIGSALAISERTVKAHLTSIFKKLHVQDRLHLAVLLKEIGK